MSCANRASRGAVERAREDCRGEEGGMPLPLKRGVGPLIGDIWDRQPIVHGRAGGGARISGVSLFGWSFFVLKIGNPMNVYFEYLN